MKRVVIAAIILAGLSADAQFVPPGKAAYTYSGGSWIAAATTSSSNPINYTPPAVALYCFNGS